jgi:hypothetical protein
MFAAATHALTSAPLLSAIDHSPSALFCAVLNEYRRAPKKSKKHQRRRFKRNMSA